MTRWQLLLLTMVLMLSGAGCSQVGFGAKAASPASATSSINSPGASSGTLTQVCSPNLVTTSRLTKILFLVDTSGSNANAGNGVPATDPDKSFRGGSILRFFTTYQTKTNFRWGFITFSVDSANPFIANANGDAIFATSSSDMSHAITQFYNDTDGGKTPYRAALASAYQLINGDSDLNASTQPNYFVILLTDGMPTDYGNPVNLDTVDADIATVVGLAPGRVSLSTVYYGSQTVDSGVALLQRMANDGKGQFANVTTNKSTFQINDLISNISTTCP